ncbi:hypothetical protein CPB86DRAFT_813242 [Serendipita vermifera]|nr:hypothetical protein CPB86DRAFT_813242 [Serendipita vermifera]
MDTYKLDDLQQRQKLNSEQDTQAGKLTSNNGAYSAVQVWALAVASLTVLITVPLLFFPRFLVFLVGTQGTLTPLEQFLSYQLGVLLLALAAGSIMATPEDSSAAHIPSNHPLMTPVTICAALSALIAWNSKGIGSLGVFVCIGTGIVGAWGFWTMLFAGSSHYSRKTGADKRTSTYLFGNKKAASVQKKEWKERQKNR